MALSASKLHAAPVRQPGKAKGPRLPLLARGSRGERAEFRTAFPPAAGRPRHLSPSLRDPLRAWHVCVKCRSTGGFGQAGRIEDMAANAEERLDEARNHLCMTGPLEECHQGPEARSASKEIN
jgi:hypothetical protein